MTQPALDLNALKAGGVIKQRQEDFFLVRLKVTLGELTSDQLAAIGDIAREYGRGKIHITTRQGIEIPWVRFADVEAVTARLAAIGIPLGACGPRVRVVVSCQGESVCPHGLGDTHSLALALDRRFYGQRGPHKLKMGVTGCPNACAKPQEHDIGFMAVAQTVLSAEEECIACGLCARVCRAKAIELVDGKPVFDHSRCYRDGECINACPTGALSAARTGWNVFLGGKWGREPQLGQPFQEFLTEEVAVELVDAVIDAWKRLAQPRERLGSLINRIGIDAFRQELAGPGPRLPEEAGADPVSLPRNGSHA